MTFSVNGYTIVDTNRNASFASANVSVSVGVLNNTTYTQAQGTVSGYTSGGLTTAPPSTQTNTVDKFPFATNSNASDVGDLTVARRLTSGQSSTVSGYTSGGFIPSPTPTYYNTIDKFPFATDANATTVGALTVARNQATGHSSTVSGYTSGGYIGSAPNAGENTIDKFPFASDVNATDVGDLTQFRYLVTGQSSTTSGYTSGGQSYPVPGNPVVYHNIIDKFPFASNANATDVGDLTRATRAATGQSSSVSGYTSGGGTGGITNTIDKFSFATDTNATDVGDLIIIKEYAAGQSSTTYGYITGGRAGGYVGTSNMQRFSFSVDANSTTVGDLTLSRTEVAGQQY